MRGTRCGRNLETGSGGICPMTEVGAVQLDLRVHDLVALDEIELYAEVLSAVAATDRPLTRSEIDIVLGLRPVAASSGATPA
jgi:hypothetical protein